MLKKNKAILEGLRADLDVARGEISSIDRETLAAFAAMPRPVIEIEEIEHFLAPVTVELESTSDRSEVSEQVTITVRVSGEYDAPTGEVWLYDNGRASRASRRLSEGSASFLVTFPFRGRHTFSVRYSGDSIYESQPLSNSVTVTVM